MFGVLNLYFLITQQGIAVYDIGLTYTCRFHRRGHQRMLDISYHHTVVVKHYAYQQRFLWRNGIMFYRILDQQLQ